MPPIPRRHRRWPASLALLIATAACDPRQVTLDPTLAQYDGIYRGSETPEALGGACAGVSGGTLKFTITEGQITLQTHRKSRRLGGTVGADGSVTMQNGDGSRHLTGSIQDGVLTGTEINGNTTRNDPYASAAPPCSSILRAVRSP
ncbi:hypothetical protein [Lichenicoccus roseus]|uniref:Uncharacterized protein n=1 Tax=Lichenicoccus roseus TaxID=2683649 RepID=A0A5R9JAJ1_9PROT|nr:hypothetical protein [Lichenicoccus roseus]TLU72621.1 hypothetical protein FE263_11300 [Lichenicoccus roseus]